MASRARLAAAAAAAAAFSGLLVTGTSVLGADSADRRDARRVGRPVGRLDRRSWINAEPGSSLLPGGYQFYDIARIPGGARPVGCRVGPGTGTAVIGKY